MTKSLRERAADLLERDGWCKGRAFGKNGTRCAVGALVAANGGAMPYDVLADFEQRLGMSLPRWNDRQTDVADVVKALRNPPAVRMYAHRDHNAPAQRGNE